MERIKMRSRDAESKIPIEYLNELYNAYEEFISDISRVIPVIKVNWNTFRTAEVGFFRFHLNSFFVRRWLK